MTLLNLFVGKVRTNKTNGVGLAPLSQTLGSNVPRHIGLTIPHCKQKMMSFRGQASWAKMTSAGGKITATVCHPTRAKCYKKFTSVIYEFLCLAGAFVRIGWKSLSRTNTLF